MRWFEEGEHVAKRVVESREQSLERLLRHVHKHLEGVAGHPDGCWDFDVHGDHMHYGIFSLNGRATPAHRASWTLHNGPIPAGLFCCHRCDRRRCVRPEHLFLGDAKANTLDMHAKGRNNNRGSRAESFDEEVAKLFPSHALMIGTSSVWGNRYLPPPMMTTPRLRVPEHIFNKAQGLAVEHGWTRGAVYLHLMGIGLAYFDQHERKVERRKAKLAVAG